VVAFARDLFAPGQDGFGGTESDRRRGAFEAGDHARHHLADLLLELVVDCIPLRFADLLDDHLLGGLRTDAARQFLRVEFDAVTAARHLAIGPVDGDGDLRFFAILPLQCRDESRLDRLEDDLLVDVLVAMNRVDDAEDFFWLHGVLGSRFAGLSACSRNPWHAGEPTP